MISSIGITFAFVQPTNPTYQPSSLFRRFFAFIIDSFIINLFAALALVGMIYFRNLNLAILSLLVGAAYKPLMEAFYGWTLGKRSQKLEVIDLATGNKPDMNQSLMRFLPWALGVCASIFVMVRLFQNPDFADVADPYQYAELLRNSEVGQSTIVSIVSNLSIFSGTWVIGDPMRQALHDKLAKTLVIATPEKKISV